MAKLERWAGPRGARAQQATGGLEMCARMKPEGHGKSRSCPCPSLEPLVLSEAPTLCLGTHGALSWPSPWEARTWSQGIRARGLTVV